MNSKSYKDTPKGKKDLNILTLIILLFSIVIGVVGVVLIVAGSGSSNLAIKIIFIILGSILAVACLVGIVISVIMFITSMSMKVDKGSVKEGNVALEGTVNAKLCPKCGTELDSEGNCSNCSRE